ncbi:MAG TPA: hypothetical protein VN365_05930 [Candidatus Thermoplasmatota archaeon]|nr:hypothetical protein [Candidatus Thermoplasmatota archaeon]
MQMKKIISISISAILIGAGLFIINQETHDGLIVRTDDISNSQNESANYSNFVEFNQEELQLKKEVVQCKITFHQDDVIEVSSKLAVLYVDETITSAYFLLTDGEKPLLEPVCLWYVPERKLLIRTPRIRLSVGKFWLVTLLQDKVGSAYNTSGHFDVQAGESWYLTLAVPTVSEKSYFSIIFNSLYESMEVTQLTRHSNLELLSPTYNQFSGRYYAIKFGMFGGGSLCDISKEITVTDGSIFYIFVAGHRKGTMMVGLPNGEEKQFNQNRIMEYAFLGNESGQWKVTIKGWSVYFRMAIVLFYIDIDPHISQH